MNIIIYICIYIYIYIYILLECSGDTAPGYECDNGWVAMHEPTNGRPLLCQGAVCEQGTVVDRERCCIQKGSCGQVKCDEVEDTVLRSNWRDIWCDQGDCDSTPIEKCCVPKSSCGAYTCTKPENRLREDADTIHCALDKGVACTDSDEDTCCIKAATCTQLACTSGYTRRTDPDNHLCQDLTCTIAADLHTCCGRKGHCSSYTCAAGKVRKANAWNILCSDDVCSGDNELTCCTYEHTCDSMECDKNYVHKKNASSIVCLGEQYEHLHKCIRRIFDPATTTATTTTTGNYRKFISKLGLKLIF